ncbi:MAG: DUF433 domain-containing protein [Candidatus Caenarcaniphilales bacterium]|jgi:uncharacterized protein (DUF433 family)|nr:DUF433 domain-containing protein [Candidatus Caenarcaniphilales bacterium]
MNIRELAESRIVMDADICHGKPRIKGTRVSVSDILLALIEGMDHTQILRNFRAIQALDIQAAIAYAFCISDNVKLRISSSFGETQLIGEGEEPMPLAEIQKIETDVFNKVLEEQASIQEDITREKVAQIKAKKIQKAQIPVASKKDPPKERPYDLLIDISSEKSTHIFSNKDHIEQGLEMNYDNYLFELRSDGKHWLCYSVRDGIEVDQAMKRNLLVTYADADGNIKQAVFEGYLTSDRQHKVFIQKNDEGLTCGRAL